MALVYTLKMNKIILFFIALSLSLGLSAQQVWSVDTSFVNGQLHLKVASFTAYTLRFSKDYKDAQILTQRGYKFKVDPHYDGNKAQTSLNIVKDSVLDLISDKDIRVEIIFQDVPSITVINKKIDRREDCGEPILINPNSWRNGLQAPKPNPSATYTQHAIVHHSAGGNGNADYTSLVRNYYVQHTQVNGWDDIGYNYLIAANGDIYIGRDKQTLAVSHYQVQGAHFCGKNAGTAGICMIGDYSDIRPSDTSVASLQKLVSYILFKEEIDATGSSIHPANGSTSLNHISGHQQGCATACPGDSMFILLSALRDSVEAQRQRCISFTDLEPVLDLPFYTFKNNVIYNYSSSTLQVYDLSNRLIAKVEPKGEYYFIPKALEVYILYAQGKKAHKVILLN